MRRALLSLSLLALTIPAFAGNRDDYTERSSYVQPLSANGRLLVHNGIGDIKIHASDRNDVRITAIRRAHGMSDSEAASRIKDLDVRVDHSPNEVRVTGSREHRSYTFFGVNGLSLDFEIEVPRTAHIDVTNNIGDIHIDGAAADVDVHENIGDVVVNYQSGARPRTARLEVNIGEVRTNLHGEERGFLGKKFTAMQEGEHSVNVKLNIGDISVHTDGSNDDKKKSRKPVDL